MHGVKYKYMGCPSVTDVMYSAYGMLIM